VAGLNRGRELPTISALSSSWRADRSRPPNRLRGEAGPTASPFGNQVSPQIEASGSAKMGGKTTQFYDCVFFAEHSERSLQSGRLILPDLCSRLRRARVFDFGGGVNARSARSRSERNSDHRRRRRRSFHVDNSAGGILGHGFGCERLRHVPEGAADRRSDLMLLHLGRSASA
jgi:hypothetical protein